MKTLRIFSLAATRAPAGRGGPALLATLLITLAGCGSGHVGSLGSLAGGGGGGTTPVGAGKQQLALTRFDVNVATGKVKVTPMSGTSKGKSRAIFTAGAITFSSSDLITNGGDAGQRELTLSLTNNTAQQLPGTVRVVIGNLAATTSLSASTVAAGTQVSLFTGQVGTSGYTDGPATAATLTSPRGIAAGTGPSAGAWIVADGNKIRRVDANGTVTTIAGQSTAGSSDGFGAAASFNTPNQVALDYAGNIYVADTLSHIVRRVTPQGSVNTIAGNGTSGDIDAAGNSAEFKNPSGIAVSSDGTEIFVSDFLNNDVRIVQFTGSDPTQSSSYTVSHIASSTAGTSGSADGVGSAATFNEPEHMILLTDPYGNQTLFLADYGNNKIRRIDSPMASAGGTVTTIAGTGTMGLADGTGDVATFNQPLGIGGYYLPTGNLVLISSNNDTGGTTAHALRTIQLNAGANPLARSSYNVVTIAGGTTSGTTEGTGTSAKFNGPYGIGVSPSTFGNSSNAVILADNAGFDIRHIAVYSGLQTGSGTSTGSEAVRLLNWTSELPNSSASPQWAVSMSGGARLQFYVPSGVNGFSFTAFVEADSDVINLPANGLSYVETLGGDGQGNTINGPGKLAEFTTPDAVASAPSSLQFQYGFPLRALVADASSGVVRAIDTSGNVTTFATGFHTGGAGPAGIAIGPDGSVWVTDNTTSTTAGVVDRISPTGTVTAINSTLNTPTGIAVDQGGNVYVTQKSAGTIERFAYISGDPSVSTNYTASALTINTGTLTTNPTGIAVDTNGQLYVISSGNTIIDQLTRSTTKFNVTSWATGLTAPGGIVLDTAHNVYVTDQNEIKRFNPAGGSGPTVIAGSTSSGFADGVSATFNTPLGLSIESFGDILVADSGNNAVREVERIVNQ